MTVTEFLKKHEPAKYVLTDRMKTPIGADWLKWIKLDETQVRSFDILADGTYRIQTDYMQDAC
jgi:hypothetical protein